jgi:hypothetical protein
MSMSKSRHVQRMLQRLEACGVREEILGDLLEEMAGGRSRAWMVRQLLALCRETLVHHIRLWVATPAGIACGLGALAAVAVSLSPIGSLIQLWLVVYYVSGMASLFAHMAAGEMPTTGSRPEERQ